MLRHLGISLLVCVTAVSLIGSAQADYPADDLNPGGGVLVEQQLQRHLPLAINEFMASNRSSMQDPQGQYDDWIEIHNYGPDAIDLGGMYLTDDLSMLSNGVFRLMIRLRPQSSRAAIC